MRKKSNNNDLFFKKKAVIIGAADIRLNARKMPERVPLYHCLPREGQAPATLSGLPGDD